MDVRRAVVTGASSGIGRAVALALAGSGHSLALAARREALLREVAAACLAAGAPAVCVVSGSVADPSLGEELVSAAASLGGGPLALVNNAGIGAFGPVATATNEALTGQIRTNLFGTILPTRALLPAMLAAGRGDIVNVVSMLATHPMPGCAAYAASKAGVLAFARCLALEVRRKGVRVSNVLPGATDTPIWDAIGGPPREEMIPASAVGDLVRDILDSPRDRSYDEVLLMPVKGVL
jgi:NAD(P)-dependent dehydrogenase (short-subunit alcohol dehydrogenase family)